VSVGVGKQLYAVRDVFGSAWVIDVSGKPTVVSTRGAPIDLKITPSLKLTEFSAKLEGLQATPAYSARNDPNTRLTQSMSISADLNAGYNSSVNQAQAAVVHAQSFASRIAGVNNADVPKIAAIGGIPIFMSPADGALNENKETARLETAQAQIAASPGSDLEPPANSDPAGFDAIEVNFQISSEHALSNPYVVTITQLREKGARPGMIRKQIYAKELHPIDNRPITVHFLEEGFPPGFELQSFEVHLYNRGIEIATSVSPERVELTRDEAFEYVKIEYIGAHGSATLPPVPAMGKLPADLPTRLASGQFGATFYVKVSKDGVANVAYSDSACTRKIGDRYLDAVVAQIRFKPALADGRPTEGVAALDLNKLTI
jgi:hypothetical protein